MTQTKTERDKVEVQVLPPEQTAVQGIQKWDTESTQQLEVVFGLVKEKLQRNLKQSSIEYFIDYAVGSGMNIEAIALLRGVRGRNFDNAISEQIRAESGLKRSAVALLQSKMPLKAVAQQ